MAPVWFWECLMCVGIVIPVLLGLIDEFTN